jgi:steroid delta-isomerase-like uncharacterized protein
MPYRWAVGATLPQGSPVDVVDAYFRAAENHDVEAVLLHFAPRATYEDVTFSFRISGHAALRSMFESAFAAMSGAVRRQLRVVAQGDVVVVEWTATGTHTGTMLGVAATGRTITLRAVSIIEIESGAIARITDYTDRSGLETQLRE